MNNLGLIIKREYIQRVSKKSFILLTFLTPFLLAALVFVPLWLASIKSDTAKTIAVFDSTGKYASLFKDTEEYRYIVPDKDIEEYRESPDKEVFAFLHITGDLLSNPAAATLYSEKQIPMGLKKEVDNVLSDYLKEEKLQSFNIPNLQEIINESNINFDIKTVKWGEDGSEQKSLVEVAPLVGLVMTLIIYMFIIMYGGMVMQSVMEEKTNRIVEVMISSVKPFDLMMGKIIAIGFVGLTQMFLWGILSTVLISGSLYLFGGGVSSEELMAAQMAVQSGGELATGQTSEMALQIQEVLNSINLKAILSCFIVYFVGGYLLYASLYSAIGGSLDQQEDAQQFMTPMIILMVFALYAGMYSMDNPDGPLAFWCSLIPFTSPIVMMVRLPYDVPIWELVLSVVILYVTAIAITWVSARIYRVGILMYGKKPSLKEMLKWLRYK